MEINIFRGEVEPVRDEILYDIANFENMNLTINVPNTWPNGTLVVNIQTSQELRMLSSVTINCQITKIVMNSGSQLSEL